MLKRPKEIDTFLSPLDNELAKLAYGVQTFNAASQTSFDLHAYVIFKFGDLIAIQKLLGVKGHNSLCPCQSCKISGVRNPNACGKVFYVPHATPQNGDHTRDDVDMTQLPMRKHSDFTEILERIQAVTSETRKDDIAKEFGVARPAAITRVSSIDLAKSVPWDWLHLLCLNIIPNLVMLWMGEFKQLDCGTEDYMISKKDWKAIGKETAHAVKNIPAAFVHILHDISKDRSSFTAESWGFWFMCFTPIFLNGRFKLKKYYNHMCLLVRIMKTTLKYKISYKEIDELQAAIVKWVQRYDK